MSPAAPPAPMPSAIAAGRARHRHHRYFLAWLLERCSALPCAGTAGRLASAGER